MILEGLGRLEKEKIQLRRNFPIREDFAEFKSSFPKYS